MRQYCNSSRIIARKYGKKANKYGARPKTVDGIRFDSTLEAEYYVYLKALKNAGVIAKLELQVKCELYPAQKHPDTGKHIRAITYVADFRVTYPDGTVEYLDTKGYEKPEFKLKAKLFIGQYKQSLWLIRKSGKNWVKEAIYA
ncbi:MAG: DUF1064 domain-containing protein [Catonella sp.]|nr:MAG: DUF1064 domain-containing protein [Catonella sp.]